MPRLTTEDREARRHGIGSSDVAEILDLSPYEGASPMRVWMEKQGLDVPEPSYEEVLHSGKPAESEDALELGHALEWPLIEYYSNKYRVAVQRGGRVGHKTLPWAFANTDAVHLDSPTIVEAKCVSFHMMRAWNREADDGIPDEVRCQIAWAMACADAERAHVVALLGGPSGFRVFEVFRDHRLEAELIQAMTVFWESVVSKVPPPVDGSRATREYLRITYPPPPEDVYLKAPDEIIALGERRAAAATAEKLGKAEKAVMDAQIEQFMGQEGCSVLDGGSWKMTRRPDRNGKVARRFTDKDRGARVGVSSSLAVAEEL